MPRFASLFLSTVALATTAQAGPAYTLCYYACMGPCCAATNGLGAAACAALCAASCTPTAAACFGDEVEVLVIGEAGGLRSVKDVAVGDLVMTLDENGQPTSTEVVQNRRDEGTFEFVELTLQRADGRTLDLAVTTDHNMARARAGPAGSLLELTSAGQLAVGDAVPVADGAGADGAASPSSPSASVASVAAVRRAFRSWKNFLVTRSGTVVANGALTTTICDGDHKQNVTGFHESVAVWRQDHGSMLQVAV